MWPRQLPQEVLADSRRSTEVKVYRALARVLDADWSVYYSRPWRGLNRSGGEVEGEADFVLAHAVHGFLFLEVKGGAISFDAERARWSSKDRLGIEHRIKDPVQQAATCKFRFRQRLRSFPNWPESELMFREGVVLPHTEDPGINAASIGGHEKYLFCHERTFNEKFAEWIFGRFGINARDSVAEPTQAGLVSVQLLGEFLTGDVRLRTSPNAAIEAELEAMDALLTGAQLRALHEIVANPRTVLEGGAGTGKTLLCAEHARREASAGSRTLLACKSPALVSLLRRSDAGGGGALTILPWSEVSNWESSRWEDFDLVIVDEAQDFTADDWSILDFYMRDLSRRLLVAVDSNQAVYASPSDVATRLGAQLVWLNVNLRNTQAIANCLRPLYDGIEIFACGPHGQDVVARATVTLSEAIQVATRMVSDVLSGGVLAGNVALLVPNDEILPAVRASLLEAGIAVSGSIDPVPGGVVVETVGRYKGLEAPVVVLIATPMLGQSRELSYVAFTRARSLLCVVGSIQEGYVGQALNRSGK